MLKVVVVSLVVLKEVIVLLFVSNTVLVLLEVAEALVVAVAKVVFFEVEVDLVVLNSVLNLSSSKNPNPPAICNSYLTTRMGLSN